MFMIKHVFYNQANNEVAQIKKLYITLVLIIRAFSFNFMYFQSNLFLATFLIQNPSFYNGFFLIIINITQPLVQKIIKIHYTVGPKNTIQPTFETLRVNSTKLMSIRLKHSKHVLMPETSISDYIYNISREFIFNVGRVF